MSDFRSLLFRNATSDPNESAVVGYLGWLSVP